MSQSAFAPVSDHVILRLAGADRVAFLQGLVSNDVARAGPDSAIWAALLSPQGRYLHDFFLAAAGDSLLLEAEAERAGDLSRRLKLYRLRAAITIEPADELRSFVAWGQALQQFHLPERGQARQVGNVVLFRDPRLADLGIRVIGPEAESRALFQANGIEEGDRSDWDRLRLRLGVPDGSKDLIPERALLLESGFDELDGVSWTKGCYVGQELTARTKYRGLVKKRLTPVTIEGEAPAPGTILQMDGQEAGEMRSARDGVGLALLRLDALLVKQPIRTESGRLTPHRPDWWTTSIS